MRDQSQRDFTGEATWELMPTLCSSCYFDALSVAKGGLVTAFKSGEARLIASLENISDSETLIAVPPGTYRIAGTVRSAISPHYPVGDARVTVEGETDQELSAVTAADGTYTLYGVRGEASIAVTKAGFETRRTRVRVTSHQTVELTLPLSADPPDVSGTYTLTVTAAADCAELPETLRVRRYTATIVQTGAGLDVSLSGARFVTSQAGTRAGTFRGTVEPSGIVLTLRGIDRWDCCSYPDLIEWTENAKYVVIDGTATLTLGPSSNGRLEGTFFALDEAPVPGWALPESSIVCPSQEHHMTLSR